MAPEKGNTLSFTALSALARALDQDGRAAVVWFLPRTGSDITMGYVTPLLGQGVHQGHNNPFIKSSILLGDFDGKGIKYGSAASGTTLLAHACLDMGRYGMPSLLHTKGLLCIAI